MTVIEPHDIPTGFLTPLRVEAVDSRTWVLLEDLVWRGTADPPDVFLVPKGDRTDFATVPWWTQSLLPRTGTWTLAAVLHDRMCEDLNTYYRQRLDYWQRNPDISWEETADLFERPLFGPLDTDFVFRKNCRSGGTGPVRSELLWLGVRYGAVANPARREGWLSTAPRVVLDTLLILLTLLTIIAGISWAWPW